MLDNFLGRLILSSSPAASTAFISSHNIRSIRPSCLRAFEPIFTMKFLAILAFAASATAAAVEKRGGEWNTWQGQACPTVTAWYTTTVTTTAWGWKTTTETCYETVTETATVTQACQEWNKWQ